MFYKSLVDQLKRMCEESDEDKLLEAIEGPYYLAWKLKPYVNVLLGNI